MPFSCPSRSVCWVPVRKGDRPVMVSQAPSIDDDGLSAHRRPFRNPEVVPERAVGGIRDSRIKPDLCERPRLAVAHGPRQGDDVVVGDDVPKSSARRVEQILTVHEGDGALLSGLSPQGSKRITPSEGLAPGQTGRKYLPIAYVPHELASRHSEYSSGRALSRHPNSGEEWQSYASPSGRSDLPRAPSTG